MAINFRLFLRQLVALTVQKNFIVFINHWVLNLFRCFILPVAFAFFLAYSSDLLNKPSQLGLGTAIPVFDLKDVIKGGQLVWTDATGGGGSPSADQIMTSVSRGLGSQQYLVSRVASIDDACPGNYNGQTSCYSAITFNSLPTSSNPTAPVNYTIRGNPTPGYVNVVQHTSDDEQGILPLQWAIDSAIIELQTGTKVAKPMQQPFTTQTNTSQKNGSQRDTLIMINAIMAIAFWVIFAGLSYQLAGAMAVERSTLLTTHLQAMGCLRSARLLSWHLSVVVPYIPLWIIAGIIWQRQLFTQTNAALMIAVNVISGFSVASWCLFAATPFAKSPQLAAIITTALAFTAAVVANVAISTNDMAMILTLVLPPAYPVFALRALAQREVELWDIRTYGSSMTFGDYGNPVLDIGPTLFAALISIFLYPLLAAWLEHLIYDAKQPGNGWSFSCFRRSKTQTKERLLSSDYAIEIDHLSKKFNAGKKNEVLAIDDLSLKIPRNGIYVILGSNGCGKSTLHGIIANVDAASTGTILFSGSDTRPRPGTLGVVPQKNVLFPELTCFQTVRLWSAIKRPVGSAVSKEVLEQLLVDCDLAAKIHSRSGDMSGGQKRKLQLAIGLVGDSDIVLVDEATSGVDPVSRRAIWKALSAVRDTRTVIFTTHFLDEADLLGDDIAILAAPGKPLAEGPPVSLKSTFGKGYVLDVVLTTDMSDAHGHAEHVHAILNEIQTLVPSATLHSTAGSSVSYQLGTTDTRLVGIVLATIEREQKRIGVAHYDTHATSLEEVFLGLMAREKGEDAVPVLNVEKTSGSGAVSYGNPDRALGPGSLTNARSISPLTQAWVIFQKRLLVTKRSWLTTVLALAILLCSCCIPLNYMAKRNENCSIDPSSTYTNRFFLPQSGVEDYMADKDASNLPVISPGDLLRSINASFTDPEFQIGSVLDGMTFEQYITRDYMRLVTGGLSIDSNWGQTLISYEASPGHYNGPVLMNTAANVIANHLRNSTGPRILTAYETFPATIPSGLGEALQWLAFAALGLCIFPAFATLCVTRERVSAVKAMQLSNGLTPAGHHLGHLLAELPIILIGFTTMIIVWSVISGRQFADLGLMWLVLVLFGLASTLFSFVASMIFSSPLMAFAAVGLGNLILFVLYFAAYMLTLTYASPMRAASDARTVHFIMGLLGPLPSVLRAIFISVNLFSLRCNGQGSFTTISPIAISMFGGPILYLVIYIIALLGALIWADSGYPFPGILAFLGRRRGSGSNSGSRPQAADILAETQRVTSARNDSLRVLHLSKQFRGAPKKAVDDVSFGVGRETLGLLGPNGAGKTTAFNIIRGGIAADSGDAFINGTSISTNTNAARVSLGVCPQFTAIDSQLTVRDHLRVYGRLKGISGRDLNQNVTTLLDVAQLTEYADRLASKLSGGNQRKLSLAISLMGNPSVVLIDEYSTGIDPATKRQMWRTLRSLSPGKAVVITTHSMEEAAALSDRVAIVSGSLLAIGTIEDLVSRHPCYEVHVNCRTPGEHGRVQKVMSTVFPDSQPAEDVATRWEVPVSDGRTLASLFQALSEQNLPAYSVERLSLESVFLKTVRNNGAASEGM